MSKFKAIFNLVILFIFIFLTTDVANAQNREQINPSANGKIIRGTTRYQTQKEKQQAEKDKQVFDSSPEKILGRKFDIIFDNSTGLKNVVARRYMLYLEQSTEKVERALKYQPKERITLILVPRRKYTHTLARPRWSGASTQKNTIIMPFEDDSRGKIDDVDDLKATLRHEYTHAVLNELSNQNCPVWLHEGLAQILGENKETSSIEFLKPWFKQNGAIPLDKLLNDRYVTDAMTVNISYAQAFLFTKYLIRKYNMARVLSFARALYNDEDVESVFHKTFNLSYTEIDRQFGGAIKSWANSSTADF